MRHLRHRRFGMTLALVGFIVTTGAARAADVEYLTSKATADLGLPFSDAVRVGEMLYLSGQIGNLPGTTELAPGGIAGEATQALDNIRRILEDHGSSMNRVVKCTVMLADIAEWPAFNEVYVTFFPGEKPARSAFAASGLALGARVEIECWATVAEVGPVEIRPASGTEAENRAKAQLERLLAEHDLDHWLYSRVVVIDEAEQIPHSHPVLTLNADFLDDDSAQLATLLHEEFHWFRGGRMKSMDAALAEFRGLFPEVPSGQTGARDERSTYLHLVICDLELQALSKLVGEEEARRVLSGWRHYTWIYEQVLENPQVRRINERHGLVVPEPGDVDAAASTREVPTTCQRPDARDLGTREGADRGLRTPPQETQCAGLLPLAAGEPLATSPGPPAGLPRLPAR